MFIHIWTCYGKALERYGEREMVRVPYGLCLCVCAVCVFVTPQSLPKNAEIALLLAAQNDNLGM